MDKKRIIHIDTKDSNSTTDKVPQISGINPVNDRTSKISGINLINDETSKVLDLRHIIMRNMPVIDPDTGVNPPGIIGQWDANPFDTQGKRRL